MGFSFLRQNSACLGDAQIISGKRRFFNLFLKRGICAAGPLSAIRNAYARTELAF
jgi:hypothetical protein